MDITKLTRRKFCITAILGGTIPHLLACTLQLQPNESVERGQPQVNEPSTMEDDAGDQIYPSTLELASEEEPGERLVISGVTYANDHETPLSGAFITIWQADTNGEYGGLRDTFQSDRHGRYELITIRPGHYQVEDTTRAAHIHFSVAAVGMIPVSGEILFEGDPHLANDAVVLAEDPEVVAAHTISLTEIEGNGGSSYQGVFDIVLQSR